MIFCVWFVCMIFCGWFSCLWKIMNEIKVKIMKKWKKRKTQNQDSIGIFRIPNAHKKMARGVICVFATARTNFCATFQESPSFCWEGVPGLFGQRNYPLTTGNSQVKNSRKYYGGNASSRRNAIKSIWYLVLTKLNNFCLKCISKSYATYGENYLSKKIVCVFLKQAEIHCGTYLLVPVVVVPAAQVVVTTI